jgi:transcription initiation factor TFIIB
VVLPPPPGAFIGSLCEELNLPASVGNRAESLLEELNDEDPSFSSGRPPAGIAAGCLYTVCLHGEHQLTQHEIADVADACVTTIRHVYQFHESRETR